MKAATRRAVTAAALTCWCSAVWAAPAIAAGEAPATQAGYWWLLQPVASIFPAPGVPDGGMYVASLPIGADAIAAIRITGAHDARLVRFTVPVASLTKVDPAVVEVFPATGKWQQGGPQSWSSRPSYNSRAKPVKAAFNAQLTTMTFTVASSEAEKGVVLVPSASGGAAGPPTFSVAFGKPQAKWVTPAAHRPDPSDSVSPSPDVDPNPGSEPATPDVAIPPFDLPTADVIVPPPAPTIAPPTQTAARVVTTKNGRSTRDTLILAFALTDVLVLALWTRRPAATREAGPRTTIYDPAPAVAADKNED